MEGLDTSSISTLSENPQKLPNSGTLWVNTTSRYLYQKHKIPNDNKLPSTQEPYLKTKVGSSSMDGDFAKLSITSARSSNTSNHSTIALNFSNKELKSIPTSIVDHETSLLILDLSNNNFKEFPIEILRLLRLKALKLDSNRIKLLPPQISCLSQLENLSMESNCMTCLPNTIAELSKTLNVLNIAQNYIDTIPEELTELTNLKVLWMQNNWFTSFPSKLSSLTALRELGLEWFKYTVPSQQIIQTDPQRDAILSLFVLCRKLASTGKSQVDFEDFLRHFSETARDIINAKDSLNRNLLHITALEKEVGIVRYLAIKKPELLDELDENNQTPLVLAVREERDLIAKILLKNKADPNAGHGPLGSALHIATARFRLGLIKELLKYGADPNSTDNEGNTSLHIVCSIFSKNLKGSKEICSLLMGAGANPNVTNYDSWAPLHLAIRREQIECLEWIIDVNNKNATHESKKFDLNIEGGSDKWTPLHLTAGLGHYEILNRLAENGVDLSARTRTGKTPREIAVNNFLMCKMLKKLEDRWIHEQLFKSTSIESKLKGLSLSSNVQNLKTLISCNSHRALESVPSARQTDAMAKTMGLKGMFQTYGPKSSAEPNLAKPKGYYIGRKASENAARDQVKSTEESSLMIGDVDEVAEVKETARIMPKSPNNIQKIQIAQNYRDHILRSSNNREFTSPRIFSERGGASQMTPGLVPITRPLNFVFPVDFNKSLKNFENYMEEVKVYQNILLKETGVSLSEKLKNIFYMQVLHMKINGALGKMSSEMFPVDLFILCEHIEDEIKKGRDPGKQGGSLQNYDIIPRTLLFVFENLDSRRSHKNAEIKARICRLFAEFKYEPAKHFLHLLFQNKKESAHLRLEAKSACNQIHKKHKNTQKPPTDTIFSERKLTSVLLSPKLDKSSRDIKKMTTGPIAGLKVNKRTMSEIGNHHSMITGNRCENIIEDDETPNPPAQQSTIGPKNIRNGNEFIKATPTRGLAGPPPSKCNVTTDQSPISKEQKFALEGENNMRNLEVKGTPKKSRADNYFNQ